MMTMYVISNATGKIVALITAGEHYVEPAGRNENKKFKDIFEDRFGSNDYSNSFTDFGVDYTAEEVEEIVIE